MLQGLMLTKFFLECWLMQMYRTLETFFETIFMFNHHYFDENTGTSLAPTVVRKGDDEELAKLRGREVYDYAPREEAGHGKLMRTRWVRTMKGQEDRSRFVAQEFAYGDPRDDFFAITLPLFSARLVVNLAETRRSRMWTLMLLDVFGVFLYAEATVH